MFSIAPRVVKRHLQQFVGGSGQIPSGPAYSPVTHTPVAVQSRRAPLRRYLHAASVAAPALHEQPSPADSFLQGNTISYVDQMYREWRANPQSVHVSWRTYFRNMEDRSRPASESFQPPPGIVSPNQGFQTPTTTQASQSQHLKLENKRASVQSLIHAYQNNGHKHARLDPLEMQPVPDIKDTPELTAEFYDLANEDLNQEYDLGSDLLPGFATTSRKSMALGDIIAACHQLYCSTYAVELQHVVDRTKREWLLSRLEIPQPIRFRRAEKGRILDDLIYSATLESLLALKYPNEKRFGLDGAESIGPAVAALIDRSADFHGVEEVVIGSCHRGRLTMSSSIYGKPYEAIFAEFAGQSSSKLLPGMTHDVRSHLGHDGERLTPDKRKVSLSLLSNPSHLEAVDPIATGKTFAAQRRWGEGAQEKVMCLALHGDAAFSGQGVVYETVNLSRLKAYGVGGTVRLMVNNQVGFTTSPSDSRSSRYCSDLMKYLDAPVFHVNADDVEATTFLCQLAADWRATFHTDCVVDIVCYRKFGHQELDLPDLTQPRMYEKISTHQSSLDRYVDRLVAEGSFTLQEIKTRREQISDQLQKAYLDSKNYVPKAQNHPRAWQGLATPEENATQELPALTTAKDEATLASIAKKITQVPAGFKLHKSLQRVFSTRAKGFAAGSVDWTTAEALAFGSLCLEGHHVRITGQDVQRGTFAQRHAVVHDQTTGHPWTALDHLAPDQARFFVGNSPLSEYGVLGFEYGFSLADPTALVVWEAQFGDFANTAQVIIDNFIANAENKWMDRSGVVLSLPHGSDGQGPEHSSARPGRFLDLCNEAADRPPDDLARQHQDCNMQVVNITSPANYFHVLRRQIRRPYRKPLVVFFSKSLLRHPLTVSSLEDLTGSSAFRPVLDDPEHGRSIEASADISRVIFCSGQVYAALHKYRKATGIKDAAIVRIEELHPFPWKEVGQTLDKYPDATTVVWAQEEPYNGGPWHYMSDRISTGIRSSDIHRGRRLLYAGRPSSATTAPGLKSLHQEELERLLKDTFTVRE